MLSLNSYKLLVSRSVRRALRWAGWALAMLLVATMAAGSYAAATVPCAAQPPNRNQSALTGLTVTHIDAPQRRVLNTHVLQDRLFMGAAQRLSRGRYFEESTETVPFSVHLAAVSLRVPPIDGPGEIELTADTRSGVLSAAVNTLHWTDPDAPTVIYHHGGGEVPYTQTVEEVFPPGTADGTNVIVVRSPFHREDGPSVVQGGGDLGRYLAMIAVAVEITEQLAQRYTPTIVTGYSLGGFVTNRHHLAYNGADAYVPFMAGTAHAEIFLTTYPAAAPTRAQPGVLRDALNFTDAWADTDHDNVYPVLGLYDCLNALDVQGSSYGETPVEVWAVRHISGLSDHDRLRTKILRTGERQKPCYAPTMNTQ